MRLRETKYSRKVWALWTLLATVLAGCQSDPIEQAPLPHEGEQVEVQLRLNLLLPDAPATGRSIAAGTPGPTAGGAAFSVGFAPEADAPATRAAAAALYNLWVFQFNQDGSFVRKPQRISTTQTAVQEGDNLSVSLTVGSRQTIYLVVTGKKIETDLSNIKTFAELQAAKLDYILSEKGGYTSAVVQSQDIPYAGYVQGVNVVSLGEGAGMVEYNTPEGFMGNIQLRQLVAKVTLKYKYEVETHTLQGVRLQNATAQISIDGSGTPGTDAEVRPLDLQPGGTPDAEGYYTASWYVAANKQGSVPGIVLEQDRYYNKETQQGSAPPRGLNFEILGSSKTEEGKYVVYQVYIGNNNTSNFDVEANHNYTLNTVFNSAEGTTDERLGETTFSKASLAFYTSKRLTTDGLCQSPSGNTFDLDAHYDFRPISMEVSGRSVDIGIYTDEACTLLAKADQTNWLRLSSEPNYTLAVNNTTAPLTNRIQVQARVPAKLNFYLYNDEYITTQDNAPNRTLYLKITTTELDVPHPAVTVDRFKIDQHPILPVGRWGGEIVDGDYTQWLGVDQVNEHNNDYTPATPSMAMYNIEWGYYGVYTGYTLDSNKKEEARDSGYESTIKLAENPKNLKETAWVAAPKRNGDKIDLYQYTYYNTFAARYCYDRNRDLDGSGALERVNKYGENEIKWYLPSINQGTGIALEGKAGDGLRTQLANESGGALCLQQTFLAAGSNLGKQYNKNFARCVRNLTPPAGSLKGAKVKVMSLPDTGDDANGSTTQYAIMDMTSLSGGTADRTAEQLYESLPLYSADGLTQLGRNVPRVRKHNTTHSLNKTIPRKLAFAPTPINPLGEPVSNIITGNLWSNAGGLYDSADDASSTRRIAVEKGCPMYKGRNGKDKPGTWRLPTQRELAPLLIFRTAFDATHAETGFITIKEYSIFSATESGAYYGALFRWDIISTLDKDNTIVYIPQIRCVRDIP